MKVLGIDPGYDRIGWAVLEKTSRSYTLYGSGLILTDRKMTPASRLLTIFSQLEELHREYKIDVLAIESLFFSANKTTAIGVAQGRGVILLQAARWGIPVVEYTPMQIKLAVTGNGHAEKQAVEKMVRMQIPGIGEGAIDDTIDAIGIALCLLVHPDVDNFTSPHL